MKTSIKLKNKLILVPTPIGNLDDITYRAVKVLHEAELILAEDTRVSGQLMKHLGVEAKMRSYHQHNEHRETDSIVEILKNGTKVALVTDAGTPAISDPGFLLVRECLKNGIDVECLPGPVAFIPALAASGLPCDRFHFEGFLPHKKGRATRINELGEYPFTLVFYESPHRIAKTIDQLKEAWGAERQAVVAREISKMFEEFIRGSLGELSTELANAKIKGEIVLIVEGNKDK